MMLIPVSLDDQAPSPPQKPPAGGCGTRVKPAAMWALGTPYCYGCWFLLRAYKPTITGKNGQYLARLVCNWCNSWVYGMFLSRIHGVYKVYEPTNITGRHHLVWRLIPGKLWGTPNDKSSHSSTMTRCHHKHHACHRDMPNFRNLKLGDVLYLNK